MSKAPMNDEPMSDAENVDVCKVLFCVKACRTALIDEDGRSKTRELALAVTKLQEAQFWIGEHLARAAMTPTNERIP